jgi:hypothetical protein
MSERDSPARKSFSGRVGRFLTRRDTARPAVDCAPMPSKKNRLLPARRAPRLRTVDVSVDCALLAAVRRECHDESLAGPAMDTFYVEMTMRKWLRQREGAEFFFVE